MTANSPVHQTLMSAIERRNLPQTQVQAFEREIRARQLFCPECWPQPQPLAEVSDPSRWVCATCDSSFPS